MVRFLGARVRKIVRLLAAAEAAIMEVSDMVPKSFPGGESKERGAGGQLFGPGANCVFRLAIAGGIALFVVALVLIDLAPRFPAFSGLNEFVRQDVPFSHEHHVGEIGIDCRFCHQFARKSSFAGIPQSQTCMKCHGVLFKDAPMLAPVRESFATGKRLSWNRVYNLADFVYFDHGIHVAKGVSCRTCHGDLGSMPWVRRVDAFFMNRCLGCHRNAGAYVAEAGARVFRGLTDCSTCHR